MSKSPPPQEQLSENPALISDPRRVLLMAFRDVIGIPGLGLFFSMVGFAAIAREAGFDLAAALATSALVWGMPGQVAMASLYLAGASVAVIVMAVALANMRMMLMVVSAVDLIGFRRYGAGLLKQLISVHFLAITTWIQLAVVRDRVADRAMYIYFLGFALPLYGIGMLGTLLGFYLIDVVPIWLLKTIVFTTPLYILMMVAKIRSLLFRQAGLLGGILAPLLYPVLGEWAILVAGVVGGTLIMLPRFMTARQVRRRRLDKRNKS
jgi:predicted branched-subunit amino acid permease